MTWEEISKELFEEKTGKRFFKDRNEIVTWIRDKETWEKLKTDDDVVNKLNELADENEQCKMMIATLRNIILENGIEINDKYWIKEIREDFE